MASEFSTAPLHDVGAFRRIIARERARADRSSREFTLVTFDYSHGSETDRQLLSQILANRVRLTDDIGFLLDGRLAAVLPETNVEGAYHLAKDVCQSLPEGSPVPEWQVYTYPSEWWLENKIEPRQSGEGINGFDSPHGDENDLLAFSLEPMFMQPRPWWKRMCDILGASAGLILLSPVMAAVWLAVRYSSPGPAIYSQYRAGHGGKPFKIYKFRSMVIDADQKKQALMALNEQDGPAFKIKNDPRITRVGHFIRKTSLDELPQLWNVIKGDMSIVGPRPLPCNEALGCTAWQRRRLEVMPGLTCIWQISGRSVVQFSDWARMDIKYQREHSFWKDVKIILLTLPSVVFGKGR